ncbi:MAG: hypothetical protein IJZ22_07780 [Bacteroidaceae bacterium]|nr:hypothetical protein [Bacteroidaceae bacterium]
MKSREIGKSRHLCDCIAEKCLEWAEYLLYAFKRKREWTSSLTESYQIYDKYKDEEFVKDFLGERSKILRLHKYRMEIKRLPHEGEKNEIGKVLLMRKEKLISQATLKIKSSDKESNRLIYWSFENNQKTV